jgi:hypothetical protein
MYCSPARLQNNATIKATFHCSVFARAGGANDFNLVKNSRAGTPRKLNEVQIRTKRFCALKSRQKKLGASRHLSQKLKHIRSARAGKADFKVHADRTRFFFEIA